VLPEGWQRTGGKEWTHSDGAKVTENPGNPEGVVAIANALPDMGALSSLNLSTNNIGADGVAFITAALKIHAIKHQRLCSYIRLGDQDRHFLAQTKDLRALLVATSNLDPPHCMPAISTYLLKEIAEWL
jgi:hypothetical protein